MARRRKAQRREIIPDALHNSELVANLVSHVMLSGKKSKAIGIVYGAMDNIREKTEQDPLEVLIRAIDNIKPRVEVKSRRVGGATYQVPVEVSPDRQMALAMRWLIQFSRQRKGVALRRALAMELLDAYNEQGNAIKRRADVYKMAQANRAFAHYRW